jgi:hypothetical protein
MPWVKIQRRRISIRRVVLYILRFLCGAAGLVLFRWTPDTGRGLAIYGMLFVALVAAMIIVTPKRKGYRPYSPK